MTTANCLRWQWRHSFSTIGLELKIVQTEKKGEWSSHLKVWQPSFWLKMHAVLLLQHWVSTAVDWHTGLTALCPGLPGWAGTRKVKPIWILLKQETVSGSGINWAICKSAPSSRQITLSSTPPLSFYRPDALPAAQPTASKHWRQKYNSQKSIAN